MNYAFFLVCKLVNLSILSYKFVDSSDAMISSLNALTKKTMVCCCQMKFLSVC